MTMRVLTAVLAAALCVALVSAQSRARTTLDLYLIDVEGGNAALLVSPAGESILIDTANGGAAAKRDTDRIMAAVQDAGLAQIDHLVTTHFHTDHIGAMPELTSRVPVRHFIDPGPNVEARMNDFVQNIYPPLYAKGTRTVAKPGDRIAMKGLDVRIPTAAGAAIKSPLPGAGKPNPFCAGFKPQAPDTTENAMSVGTHVTFGRFRLLHLGDLTVNKEFDLMCPSNPLGTIDLLVGSHHSQAISNDAVLVHAIEPRVVLMNNGIRKGGQPDAMKVFFSAPGVEDIWQLHFSQLSGQEYTVPGMFIANLVDEQPADMAIAPFTPPARGAVGPPPVPAPVHNGPAFWFKVSARNDGSFTVTNQRNGFTKSYAARSGR
jgi:beta-lactamase superfamily II metal-dependent hydrolase